MSLSTPSTILQEQRIKLFVVDDDALYLKLLESQFAENPLIDVVPFSSGEECLNQLHLRPDIIVLDYFLNGKNKEARDGLSILAEIKKTNPRIQVIMLSSHENVEIAMNCIRTDAFNFIVKNETTFIRLKHTIKQIFHQYSKVKELLVWDW